MSNLFRKSWLAVVVAALLSLSLTACDGGDDADATSPTNSTSPKPGGG